MPLRTDAEVSRLIEVILLLGGGAAETGREMCESGGDRPVERDGDEGRGSGGGGGGEEPGEAEAGEMQEADGHGNRMHSGGM